MKKAVGNLVSQDRKHTTSVDEEVRQPATNEHVRPREHENITKSVDKDIHQDHHHTTVQPVNAREVLFVALYSNLGNLDLTYIQP